ncbi:MAG: hypothetical protein ACR2NU_05450 [Aeoliella sp.]
MLRSFNGVISAAASAAALLFFATTLSSVMADEVRALLLVKPVEGEASTTAAAEATCEACEAGTCTNENCKAKKCAEDECEQSECEEVKCEACVAGTCTDQKCAAKVAATTISATPGSEAQLATPTHRQTKLIKANLEDLEKTKLNCFCVAGDGRILAGCGTSNEDGEIRVFDAAGEYVETWSVPVKVEAVNVRASDGAVFIGGNGRLVKLDESGALLADKESPHASVSKEMAEKIRESVIVQIKQRAKMYERQIGVYEQQIEMTDEQIETIQDQIEELDAADDDGDNDGDDDGDDGDDGDDDDEEEDTSVAEKQNLKQLKRQLTQLERTKTQLARTLEVWKKQVERLGSSEPTEEEIQQQVESQIARKLGIASISAVGDTVFIACSASVGYGYSVWTIDEDFEEGKEIVEGLSGCCGQMDVQACPSGIYVAENSRARVVCFDTNGEELHSWGSKAREGIRGFGSCCNPMNVAFGPNDTVYTAESGSGRIKQFSSEGELLQVVGSADLVPGCKKVSIGATSDGNRLYMLDITRDHIVMMDRIPADERSEMIADVEAESELSTEKQASKSLGSALGRIFARTLQVAE